MKMEKKVEAMIYVVRGQKVMIDSDLAELYGVLTKNLNKAAKRNSSRFPEDFMFTLTETEFDNWRSANDGSLLSKWNLIPRITVEHQFADEIVNIIHTVNAEPFIELLH